jgi:hypothetical protein
MKKLIYMAVLAAALVALVAPQAFAAEGDEKFKMHGEVRLRGEHMANWNDFNDSGTSDDQALYWPSRARLAFEGQFTKNVSAWVEIQHGWVWGNTDAGFNGNSPAGFVRYGGNGPNDSNLELYQASVTLDQLWSDRFSLTFGRQELSLGNELLLGDNDFYMGFTHDGLTGVWDFDKVDLTVWYFREGEGSVGSIAAAVPPAFTIPGTVSGGHDFLGGYSTWGFKDDMMLDFYLMYQNVRNDGNNFIFSVPVVNNLMTAGVRFSKDRMGEKGFIWNIEYAQQFGEIETTSPVPFRQYDEDADGSILEAMFGYNFHRGDNNHRIYGRYMMVSGNDSTDADWNGFVGIAGDFHDRLGKGDWFLPDTTVSGGGLAGTGRGIDAWTIGYNGFFNDRHEFGIAYWDYTINEMAGTAPGTPDDLGSAYDIWYGFNYTRNVAFEASYSSLDPGEWLVSPGQPDDAATRLYGQMRFRF